MNDFPRSLTTARTWEIVALHATLSFGTGLTLVMFDVRNGWSALVLATGIVLAIVAAALHGTMPENTAAADSESVSSRAVGRHLVAVPTPRDNGVYDCEVMGL